ncbi:torsin-1A-like [Micropterus salmoides]|uniref:torsin-1A-like n=1 Tax=Micropterus salmoides TaxID=27706 RepID=UPI0018EB333F|nr:torsin-1A-like [Micropterus salmoides]
MDTDKSTERELNTGGQTITQTALDFWKAGDREKIELRDLETSIPVSAFNNNGGLWYSHLIVENPVDFFIPFLPLEYRHVVQCAISEMRDRGFKPDQNEAEKMAKDLVYFPETERVFSVKGCKTVQSKLDYYIK